MKSLFSIFSSVTSITVNSNSSYFNPDWRRLWGVWLCNSLFSVLAQTLNQSSPKPQSLVTTTLKTDHGEVTSCSPLVTQDASFNLSYLSQQHDWLTVWGSRVSSYGGLLQTLRKRLLWSSLQSLNSPVWLPTGAGQNLRDEGWRVGGT